MPCKACLLLSAITLFTYVIYPCRSYSDWYKGDLHTHSIYSDGDSPVAEVIANAEEIGLDFFALTDHDTSMEGNPSHWYDPDYHSEAMVLLYGVEWTSLLGHANVWATTPFTYQELWQANQENDAYAASQAAHAQGALFSINHPAAFLVCPWVYPVYEGIDSLEVWNAMFFLPNFNRWSVRHVWDELLRNGQRISGVGGSDMHQLVGPLSLLYGLGNPTIWVWADDLTAEGVLTGIKAGHSSISYAPFAPRIDFTADADSDGEYETMVGDAIVNELGHEILFKVQIEYQKEYGRAAGGELVELGEPMVRYLREEGVAVDEMLNLLLLGDNQGCQDTYGVAVFKNGDLFKMWILWGEVSFITFDDVPEVSLPTYYRVELLGIPEVAPLLLSLYGMQIALTNPIYVNFSH